MNKIPVGILGATGMVGQRFVSLLENHPWFEVVAVAASPRSKGKSYDEAVAQRWKLEESLPEYVSQLKLYAVEDDLIEITEKVTLVFSCLDMEKKDIQRIEESYAARGIVVVSNNSAHRWTQDIPMIMPEVNPDHTELIDVQRENRGWEKGAIVVKPNCSLQTYIPIIHALSDFGPSEIEVTTLQAISGAGKTFTDWPEMVENCIPFISGEEEKTEKEPLKILGKLSDATIQLNDSLKISATCIRVPVTDGHMASVAVKFSNKPTPQEIEHAIKEYQNPLTKLQLPSAPEPFIHFFADSDRPQTLLDRELGKGMAISCGRFRKDPLFDWKFVSLAHNTIRGAAGGAILTAEFLKAQGYVKA